MTLIISNVKEEYIEAFQGLANGIHADMEICKQKIPNEETQQAIRECKKGQAKEHESFSELWEEVEKEVHAETTN